jgi:DNA-binding FadR family transcriptional regulator
MQTLINKQSLADKVAAKIQEQVSLGRYKVNDKLPIEPELMKNFGVGRSTIREAIKILSNSGLLRVQQGVGTFIENPTGGDEPFNQRLKRANVQDLNEVRELIELKIAEKAATNRSDKDIAIMTAYLAQRNQAAQANLLEACIEADVNFHIAIAEASKNEILADIFKSASHHLKKWFTQLYEDTGVFIKSQHLHEQLLQNIIARDAKQAWQSVAAILEHRL